MKRFEVFMLIAAGIAIGLFCRLPQPALEAAPAQELEHLKQENRMLKSQLDDQDNTIDQLQTELDAYKN
jgi:hypothetical protein